MGRWSWRKCGSPPPPGEKNDLGATRPSARVRCTELARSRRPVDLDHGRMPCSGPVSQATRGGTDRVTRPGHRSGSRPGVPARRTRAARNYFANSSVNGHQVVQAPSPACRVETQILQRCAGAGPSHSSAGPPAPQGRPSCDRSTRTRITSQTSDMNVHAHPSPSRLRTHEVQIVTLSSVDRRSLCVSHTYEQGRSGC